MRRIPYIPFSPSGGQVKTTQVAGDRIAGLAYDWFDLRDFSTGKDE
jgi:hypothetical protein